MRSARYISLDEVISLHYLVMTTTESAPTEVRDFGRLESAIMRPQMAAHYEQADLIRQAVLLAVGISQAQAFLDGNKRTAFVACDIFLERNGLLFDGEPIDFAQQLELIASREDDLDSATTRFESWLRERITQTDSQ